MALTPDQHAAFVPLLEQAEAEGWAGWIRSDADRLAMLDGCRFDAEAAGRAYAFCRQFLRLENPTPRDGRGPVVPFELLDFQYYDIVGPIFGWKRAEGTRRFRTAFVSVAKGNTKSALAAAILLYGTFAEGEPVALSYACSTTRQTARNVFKFCSRMVRKSPALSKRLKVLDHGGKIVDPVTFNELSIAPNTAGAVEGKDVHIYVYDEIHLAKDRELYDALTYGGRSRSQPLGVVITTAAKDRTSIAFELYEDAKKLLDGTVVDHSRFAYIAEAEHDDDPLDPDVWRKANPALGVTVNADDFAAHAQQAADSPAKMVNFKARRLNVWGLDDTSTYLDIQRWLACRADVSEEALLGRECYGGLDMSSNTDLTALVLAFPDDDGSIDLLAYHWIPADVLPQRAKDECDRYPGWVLEGVLETTDGDFIDQGHIRARIRELGTRFQIKELAYDPTFMSDLGPKLADDGFDVFEFWQTARMYTPVMAKLDALVLAGQVRHNNPLLDWQASNLRAQVNEAGHMKPAKPRGSAKIDGMAALLMSLGQIVKGESDDAYDVDAVMTF